MINNTELLEEDKYVRAWKEDKYRINSPGMRIIELAFKELGMKSGETVIDFGCGCGRPAKWFQNQGLIVSAVDIAHNCLDPGLINELDFVIANLWDLPPMYAKYGYCTDVMEHIPPNYVDITLKNIKRSCDKVFFQIATFKHNFRTNTFNEELHLTVMPAGWWKEKLEDLWGNVKIVEGRGIAAICEL